MLISNSYTLIEITKNYLPKEFALEILQTRDSAVISLLNRKTLPEIFLLDYSLGYGFEHPEDINYFEEELKINEIEYIPRWPIIELVDFLLLHKITPSQIIGYFGISAGIKPNVYSFLKEKGIKSISYPTRHENTLEQLLKL